MGLRERRWTAVGQPVASPRQQHVHATRYEQAIVGREEVELLEEAQFRLLTDQGRIYRCYPTQAVLVIEPRPAALFSNLPELAPRAPARDLGGDELPQTVYEALLVLHYARLLTAVLCGRAANDPHEQPTADVALVGRDPSRLGIELVGKQQQSRGRGDWL